MIQTESRSVEERDLPATIDFYEITSSGTVRVSTGQSADAYISEDDVRYFNDVETMLHIRKTFGRYIGVMRDTSYTIRPREYKTPKMLLGVVRKPAQQKGR